MLLNYLENHLSYDKARLLLDLPYGTMDELLFFLYPLASKDNESDSFQRFKIYCLYDKFSISLHKELFAFFAYPFLLLIMGFFFSLVMLSVLIPHVEGLFSAYLPDMVLLMIARSFSFLGMLIIFLIFALLMLLIMVGLSPWSVLLMIFLSRFQWVKQYLTLLLAKCMTLFLQQGFSEVILFISLRKKAPSPYVRWLSYYPDLDFREGIDFFDLYYQDIFDPQFAILMKNVSLHHPLSFWLDAYLTMTRNAIVTNLKRKAQLLKFSAMAYLLLLVALFYQIMYLPMKMMEVL